MDTNRNYGAELDELKKELGKMRECIAALSQKLNRGSGPAQKRYPENKNENKRGENGKQPMASDEDTTKHLHRMNHLYPDPALQAAMKELEDDCIASKDMGRITYLGMFVSGGRQSNWVRKSVPAGSLLALIESREAEKVLACIGSGDKLHLLLALLKKPMTVNQLVEECGFRSTGQVYHHIKPLLAADLIAEDAENEGKGYYVVRPHRVQGIIMLLAGISDMLDPPYTSGSWDSRDEN